MRYIIGIALSAMGVVLIVKTEWFIANFGTSAWAEEKFGMSGGTRTMYKLIGLAFVFIGFLTLTGLISGFLMATVGRLFIR